MDYQTELNIEEILEYNLNDQYLKDNDFDFGVVNETSDENSDTTMESAVNASPESIVFFGDGSHTMNINGSITIYVYGGNVTINTKSPAKKARKHAITIDKPNNSKFYPSTSKPLCTEKDCEILAGFGIPGQEPIKCSKHRNPEHKCLIKPRCESCIAFAIYGVGNIKTRCITHRESGDVLLVKKICKFEGCTKRAAYYRREKNDYTFRCAYHFEKDDLTL